MKKLLLASSLCLFIFAAWSSCNHHTSKGHDKEVSKAGDPVIHGSPDQARLDSLKDVKTKGKQ